MKAFCLRVHGRLLQVVEKLGRRCSSGTQQPVRVLRVSRRPGIKVPSAPERPVGFRRQRRVPHLSVVVVLAIGTASITDVVEGTLRRCASARVLLTWLRIHATSTCKSRYFQFTGQFLQQQLALRNGYLGGGRSGFSRCAGHCYAHPCTAANVSPNLSMREGRQRSSAVRLGSTLCGDVRTSIDRGEKWESPEKAYKSKQHKHCWA